MRVMRSPSAGEGFFNGLPGLAGREPGGPLHAEFLAGGAARVKRLFGLAGIALPGNAALEHTIPFSASSHFPARH